MTPENIKYATSIHFMFYVHEDHKFAGFAEQETTIY